MKSVMSHQFSRVPTADIQRSQFNRSHGYKTTFDAGYLIPFYLDEALPGDTFNCRVTHFARLATPIAPIMDNIYLDTFFFAVPLRLVWDNFQKFMGEQVDPGDSTDYVIPTMTAPASGGHAEGSLSDYMGIPTGIASLKHSSLFHRSYSLVWNTWFRDENLQDSVVVDKGDGPDTSTDYVLKRRGKRHDYFTSCLPWPQKGDAVSLPLGTSAPIESTGPLIYENASLDYGNVKYENASNHMYIGNRVGTWGADANLYYKTGLQTDLDTATAATVNQLRQAFQIQRLLERDARGGTRYTEIVRSHFNVVSPDARLQRPEYLGGGSTPVNITPVPQTSESNTTAQGNLAGYGTSVGVNNGFVHSFTEHCIIIGLISARADLNYQQGLNRMFSRSTRYDFYWPALSHIGEQAVLNKEIYADGTSADEDVFGYQERYAEYRYKPSLVTGAFRSNAATSLDVWHLSQDFTSLPALNDSFIQDDPPIDRVIAVPSEPHFLLDCFIDLKTARPMPTYSVPGMIDHF